MNRRDFIKGVVAAIAAAAILPHAVPWPMRGPPPLDEWWAIRIMRFKDGRTRGWLRCESWGDDYVEIPPESVREHVDICDEFDRFVVHVEQHGEWIEYRLPADQMPEEVVVAVDIHPGRGEVRMVCWGQVIHFETDWSGSAKQELERVDHAPYAGGWSVTIDDYALDWAEVPT